MKVYLLYYDRFDGDGRWLVGIYSSLKSAKLRAKEINDSFDDFRLNWEDQSC